MQIVIVGGVAGGASAAARARRLSEEAQIVMFERGEHISFANCGLPYYIGGAIKERERLLVQTPESLHRRFRIDVRTRTEVVRIIPERKQVVARDLTTGREETVDYDKLVLSPGAQPVVPPIPGVELPRVFTLRNVLDTDAIKAAVDAAPTGRAVVVGGGYVGLEMVEALRERGMDVVLVELAEQVMGPVDPEMAAPLHQHLKLHGVDLRLGCSVKAFHDAGAGLHAELSTGETIDCTLAILAIGVRPEVDLARDAGVALGERGGIVVDAQMRTNLPDVFAVGDAVEVTDLVGDCPALIPLAGPANRQGRIAADNCFGRESTYGATQGTAICKVFDLAVGMTGASEKALHRQGRACEKVYVHPASHAGYYPGAAPMSLKLIFDPADGRVLGAQVVGADGVDKRTDVLAIAVRAGLTVFDLEEMELAYAPPFGSAKDPVNYAGFVAANVLRGDAALCHSDDVNNLSEDQLLLDVRTPAEVAAGTIPGAVNIPVDDLRERMGELPTDRELLIFCKVGLRGYLACRILTQNGFGCRNLTGGYTTWQAASGAMDEPKPLSRDVHDDTGATSEDAPAPEAQVVAEIDAVAMQCPGPIMRLTEAMENLQPGQAVAITVADPGFPPDVAAWCRSTGNRLVSVEPIAGGNMCATVARGGVAAAPIRSAAKRKTTLVVFSADFDRAMAAFIIANGARAMGSEVTIFFTFWGLNVLRRSESVSVKKTFVEKMFGFMMPRGAEKLKLSKMNMAGIGTRMMKGIMKKKHAPALPDLIESARATGVRMVACTMSMDMMGLQMAELVDGVEEGGVASYLGEAAQGEVNLFI
jgi:NADPH-dependent 2,4-dienoyl-CoA reductase/sulfur reductase-like enzyme/peroxiredoxin family protein/rhodanese-related sulfurtransferase/TusA-related sulfurtransferase